MKQWFLIICSLIANACFAQQPVTLHFVHTLNGNPVAKGKILKTPQGTEYELSHWKYYITSPSFTHSYNANNVFLIDAFGNDSLVIHLPNGKYKDLSFYIGVDSLYNVSGAQDGALDPLNGMFWTWNTGYINYKFEGFTGRKKFEYHLGGFSGSEKTMQYVQIKLPKKLKVKNKPLHMYIPVEANDFWNAQPTDILHVSPVIAKPGTDAVKMAGTLPLLFNKIIIIP